MITHTHKVEASAIDLEDQDAPSDARFTFTGATMARLVELRGALLLFGASAITVHSLPGLQVQWLDEDGDEWEDPDGIHLRDPVISVYEGHLVYKELTRDDDGSVAVRFDAEAMFKAATA